MLDRRVADTEEWEADGFHPFIDGEGHMYGSFEVFFVDADNMARIMGEEAAEEYQEGWYWWNAFPDLRLTPTPIALSHRLKRPIRTHWSTHANWRADYKKDKYQSD